ncbi:MAG: DUF3179 domain-containing protein [Candidatus Aminicenantes bacterium]|jgi:hypothetical protein
MSGKRFLVYGLIIGLFISGCTSAAKFGPPHGEEASGESDPGIQIRESAGEKGNVEEQVELETIDQESKGDQMPSDERSSCKDPFDGEQPAFNTAYWEKTDFCKHNVDYDTIISGGPPPDGIPPLDAPRFVATESADEWLEDREPVILFQIDQDVRAYPLQIMTWHEIVNDEVAGVPVVVTFCPLCNTALVFKRPTVDQQTLTFGTSGNLRNSDLVMYDRQTESWWQQFTGTAIVGELTGEQLQLLPAALISWGDFRDEYPEGKVLSRDTGYNRRYGSNPYVGYDDIDSSPFLFQGDVDDRLQPMARVVGLVSDGGQVKSFSYRRLKEESVIHDSLEGTVIVIFYKEGTDSALDASNIPEGRDVGATGVFEALVDGEELAFIGDGNGMIRDVQTNSMWNIVGVAIEGPLAGKQLTPVPHFDTFWFAWAAFQTPDSLVE